MSDIVTFGEIMLRLAAPGRSRFAQVLPGSLNAAFAGAEANVAVGLAQFGRPVRFVSALPRGLLTEACLATLRGQGVCVDDCVVTDRGRFGQFFVETGANQRPTRVHYDRDGSAVSLAGPQSYAWSRVLADAEWLHVSGITPALSEAAFHATRTAMQTAREYRVPVSLDVNYRSALWRWDGRNQPQQLAAATLQELLPLATAVFAGPGDAPLLGLSADEMPSDTAEGDPQRLTQFCEVVTQRCPEVRWIATTLREQKSASQNTYGGVLYDAAERRLLTAPLKDGQFQPWEIHEIVDRVGSGDAFAAGLIDGLTQSSTSDPQAVLEFATAAGCLAHSVIGDFLFCSRDEVLALVRGESSGRIQR